MTVLFYCQHALGMGHFVRSIALAERLAADFRVVFLNGGALPDGLTFPSTVERIDLPPLGMTEDGALISLTTAFTPDSALAHRRDRMVRLLTTIRPDVLLIELFPFGRRKFEAELRPLVEAARAGRPPLGESVHSGEPSPLSDRRASAPLVVSSVRDLLVTGRRDQQRFDDRAARLCDRFFDLVLVHADPALASFDESFRPSEPLRTPIVHTGFIGRPLPAADAVPRSGVLVSAGGGLVGDPLFRNAVDAHRENYPATGLHTTIVAGPFAPAATCEWLQRVAADTPGLSVVPCVPDLRPLLQRAAISVSQCGYNTALDVVTTGTPALVVPFGDGQENEQQRRAERLAARGLLRWLPASSGDGRRLAAAIRDMRTFVPAAVGLQVNGAERTARILRDALTAVDGRRVDVTDGALAAPGQAGRA